MRLNKSILTALALVATLLLSIGCKGNEEKTEDITYTIIFDFQSYAGSSFASWQNSIMNAYESAIGVTSEVFTLKGTYSECDAKVLAACKKAEETVKTIRGGTAYISVTNGRNQIVYAYKVNP